MSCVEAAETLGWDRLKQYQEEKDDSQDKGKRKRQSGRNCLCGRNPRIIPASQLALDYVEDTTEFVGKNAGSARDYGGFRPPEACVVRKGRPEKRKRSA